MIYDFRFMISEMPTRKITPASVRQPGRADLPVCLLPSFSRNVKLAARQRRPATHKAAARCCPKSSIVNRKS
jgi:hypothetical protein